MMLSAYEVNVHHILYAYCKNAMNKYALTCILMLQGVMKICIGCDKITTYLTCTVSVCVPFIVIVLTRVNKIWHLFINNWWNWLLCVVRLKEKNMISENWYEHDASIKIATYLTCNACVFSLIFIVLTWVPNFNFPNWFVPLTTDDPSNCVCRTTNSAIIGHAVYDFQQA